MNIFFIIYLSFLVFYFFNNLIKQKNYLQNYKGEIHQKFLGSINIPLTGGIFLIFSFSLLFNSYNLLLCSFIFLIFSVGFLSDINVLSSPKLRLLIQFLIIISFVILLDIKINQTRFIILDILLKNIYFKYLFSALCLLILINGSNFIDGLNGLLLGYFSLITLVIFYLDFHSYLALDENSINLFLLTLAYLLILNFNNKLFMGDSGSYALSLSIGYFLIKFYEFNQEISPYFIILLLWYPCFENLFSIIRKFSFKKSPVNADNNHLHQLIFFYFKKKNFLKNLNINNISSCFINLYNLIIFAISLHDPSNSINQICLVFFNVMIYLILYFKLFNFKYKLNQLTKK
jgi:UDP-N-acetylmuramyl pentapeptide phosphotransferase/UDP-N-acetylglucosamine-1-phosphate transferase